ncbi:MAG: hypothetical protein V4579_03575 [Pseudomonadota bacterium]
MMMDASLIARPDARRLLSPEETGALAAALVVHAALIAWLALNPPAPAVPPLPERMTVTISNEVAERSTSPDPAAQAAPAIAPVISENPVPEPAPVPLVRPAPVPSPVAAPPPPPRPAQTKPAPVKAPPKPAQKPAGGGASRIGDDFLRGVPGGQTPGARSQSPAAQAIGPAVKSALSGAITRQLRPRWAAPQGAEADQLVTVLSWDMNPDGSLAGSPRVVSQAGITDANRAQAQRHAEQAVRAVRLAAPFDLPSDLYPAWKRVVSFRFDRKLSQ